MGTMHFNAYPELHKHTRSLLVYFFTQSGHFLIFQDGGRRHLGFTKRQISNGRTRQEGRTASPCQILSKSFNMCGRHMAIFRPFNMAASAILDF